MVASLTHIASINSWSQTLKLSFNILEESDKVDLAMKIWNMFLFDVIIK